MEEFGVGSMVAVLPLSLYVLALGLGPLIGGPLSETVGRYPVYSRRCIKRGLLGYLYSAILCGLLLRIVLGHSCRDYQ